MDSLPKHFDVYVQLVLRESFAKEVSINLFYYFKYLENVLTVIDTIVSLFLGYYISIPPNQYLKCCGLRRGFSTIIYIEDITWPRGDTKFLFEC